MLSPFPRNNMLLPRQAVGSKKRRPDSIIQSCVDTCVFQTRHGSHTQKRERERRKELSTYVGRQSLVFCFSFFGDDGFGVGCCRIWFCVFFQYIYIRLEDHNLMTEETGAPKQPRRRLQRTYTKSHHT